MRERERERERRKRQFCVFETILSVKEDTWNVVVPKI
jgi:hypothetical protein